MIGKRNKQRYNSVISIARTYLHNFKYFASLLLGMPSLKCKHCGAIKPIIDDTCSFCGSRMVILKEPSNEEDKPNKEDTMQNIDLDTIKNAVEDAVEKAISKIKPIDESEPKEANINEIFVYYKHRIRIMKKKGKTKMASKFLSLKSSISKSKDLTDEEKKALIEMIGEINLKK